MIGPESEENDENLTPYLSLKIGRALSPWLGSFLATIAIIWASGLLTEFGFNLITEQVICGVLGLAFPLIFINTAPNNRSRNKIPWYDSLAAIIGFLLGWYMFFRYPLLLDEFAYKPIETNIVGFFLVILTAESLRRTAGWSLLIILALFLLYGLFGDKVPGLLAGRALEINKFFPYLGIDTNALLGTPLIIIFTVVVIFIFLGQVLLRSGGSDFFTDLAAAIMGHSRGGSAKIAVVASGMFGSISGSAVSNVASTGVITIPLMRQGGYSPRVAGAIEAVASTGGQIMPPIMGAAAFLMAELADVLYQEVIIVAILPALLYYTSVFLQADLEAGKIGIKPIPAEQIPQILNVISAGWYFFVPFIILLTTLFWLNYPPETAALFGALSICLLGSLFKYNNKRLTPNILWICLQKTGEVSVDIIVIGAAAGLIIGVLEATGLSFGLTFMLVQVGEGNLLLLLVLTAVICIVLGMGMPTTAIYFLLAVLATQPMIDLGVEPLAAHLFVLYFGLMSMITPPVALAAFTAAKLANTHPMSTALSACQFGWPAFIVPFLFVLAPNLIMIGNWIDISIAFFTAIMGIWFTSAGIIGFLRTKLSPIQRILYVVGGLALLLPNQVFETNHVIEIAGAIICFTSFTFEKSNKKR